MTEPSPTSTASSEIPGYLDKAARQQLELLAHRLRNDDSLHLLLGDPGSGRSTTLAQLNALTEDELLLVTLSGLEIDGPESGVAALLDALGETPPTQPDEAQQALTRHLLARNERGRATALAIDDADQLSVQQLEDWLGWWQALRSQQTQLPLLLAGSDQLAPYAEGLLENSDASPAITRLRPLGIGRARDFLEHTLSEAELGELFPFSPVELGELYQLSGGLPGPLLAAAQAALAEDQSVVAKLWERARARGAQGWALLRQRVPGLPSGLPEALGDRRVLLGLALIGVALLLFAVEGENPDGEAPLGPVVKNIPIRLPASPQEPTSPPSRGGEPAGLSVLAEPANMPPQPPAPEAPMPDSTAVQPEPASPVPNPARGTPGNDAQAADTPPPSRLQTLAEVRAAEKAEQKVASVGDTAAPLEPPRAKPDSSTASAEKPSAVKQPSGLIPPLGLLTPATSEPAAQSPAPATTAKPATSSGQSTSDDDWILARAGDHYTLQLLASRDRGTLDAFVTRHKLSGELHQFSLTRDGQRLFVQLFGDFASRDAANQALGKLPADVRSQKPWLRSFSSIQRIIREQGR